MQFSLLQRKFGGKDHKGKDHKRSHGNRMITSLFADEPSNIPYDCLYKGINIGNVYNIEDINNSSSNNLMVYVERQDTV